MYFDLLPDFIGYIMIATALHHLGSTQPLFNRAKWVAIAMIFLTLPHVLMQSNVTLSGFQSLSIKLHLYSEGLLALHVLMAYWIFGALALMAQHTGQKVLLATMQIRRDVYLVINVSQLVLYPFLLNVEASWIMMLFGFGILSLSMELLFIRLPFRFSIIKS
jgi:hypothetical protein